jgi:AcrR family transcriptional regulator
VTSHNTAAKKKKKKKAASRVRAPRMDSAERKRMIVEKAIEYFAKNGFEGSTRDLAREIGVVQSLVYRYFPRKELLLDQVYEEVYLARWNPHWESDLRNRDVPFEARLKKYYLDYAQNVLRNDWVRILIFAGLKQEGINDRLFKLLHDSIFTTVITEFHHAFPSPTPIDRDKRELELELVWSLHAAIFYISMRKWVYKTRIPSKINSVIEVLVEGFIQSLKHLNRGGDPLDHVAESQADRLKGSGLKLAKLDSARSRGGRNLIAP